MPRILLTQALVRQFLHYDAETGVFTNIGPRGSRGIAGAVAGGMEVKDGETRWKIGLLGGRYYAHRLAWLYVHGFMPDEVDHEDRNAMNNRLSNLRLCTRHQNTGNSLRKNQSGFKGVVFDADRNRWRATIKENGKHVHLGRFHTPEEAHAAYAVAAARVFGSFARTAA